MSNSKAAIARRARRERRRKRYLLALQIAQAVVNKQRPAPAMLGAFARMSGGAK